MEKVKGNSEIDAVLNKLMREEIAPHTCQLFEQGSDGQMKPYASGVLAMLGGTHYLLTASHVTENWSNDHQLFTRTRKGYVSIVGDLRETDIEKSNGLDLAYIKLDANVVPAIEAGHKFLPISKFRKHSKLLDSTQYCVIGFPTINKKIVDGKLKTGASGYFLHPSADKVYEHYRLNPTTHFALEMKGKGTDLIIGEVGKFKTEHYGLSGCGLWLVLLNSDGTSYTADFRLVGIMTEFKKGKYHCLIGNRIDVILDALQRYEGLSLSPRPAE